MKIEICEIKGERERTQKSMKFEQIK